MPAISDLFAQIGDPFRLKLITVGPNLVSSEMWSSQLRSLNLEHVSPAGLLQQEISRRTPIGSVAERAARHGKPVTDDTLFAVMRKWFWTRKPDAGFALDGFPATLLQAKVFDEWLEARGEALNGVLFSGNLYGEPVIDHYRTLGLLLLKVSVASGPV